MNRSEEILNELRELQSPLAAMPWHSPFAIPERYWETLTQALADGVRFAEKEEHLVSDWSSDMPFSVPEGYFDTLAAKLSLEKEKPASKEIAATPYEVPPGYLTQLPQQLTEAAVSHSAQTAGRSKTISFRPAWGKAARMAAAAVLVLGIGIGSYRLLKTPSPEVRLSQELAQLDEAAIDSYVEQHLDEFDSESLENALAAGEPEHATINGLETNEIQDYLRETGDLPTESVGSQSL